MIDNRRAGEHQDDLLSILLRARHEEDGRTMTDREIAEEALGMIVGGHETSSAALTWICQSLPTPPSMGVWNPRSTTRSIKKFTWSISSVL